jgi:hypothetical protein
MKSSRKLCGHVVGKRQGQQEVSTGTDVTTWLARHSWLTRTVVTTHAPPHIHTHVVLSTTSPCMTASSMFGRVDAGDGRCRKTTVTTQQWAAGSLPHRRAVQTACEALQRGFEPSAAVTCWTAGPPEPTCQMAATADTEQEIHHRMKERREGERERKRGVECSCEHQPYRHRRQPPRYIQTTVRTCRKLSSDSRDIRSRVRAGEAGEAGERAPGGTNVALAPPPSAPAAGCVPRT